jgi:hypothetical protein
MIRRVLCVLTAVFISTLGLVTSSGSEVLDELNATVEPRSHSVILGETFTVQDHSHQRW